ncbi:MAG: hypothetical protein H6Q99_358 [Proteobacteria bacterium]|nr:hypothetical protein [Pseudomonadota bacterium]
MGGTAGTEELVRPETDFSPDRLAAANIHPDTRLATDYLNHFNEVVMLIDMLPMMPDCAPDVVDWQPCSYVDHFRLSHFKERDLAIAAYEASEPDRRRAFEDTVARIDAAMTSLQRMIIDAPMDALPIEALSDLSEMRIKPLLAHAMGLINGAPVAAAVTEDTGDAQSAVDALFG